MTERDRPFRALLQQPWCRALCPALFFFGVAVVGTWPLVLHLTTHLPAGGNDLYQNVWNLWWWKKAFFDLKTSPYFTPLLYAPEGLDLTFHTHSPLMMLLALPVNLLLGPVAAYNAACLIAVFLCGVGAYLLARELVGQETAAYAGGLIFALFPQHLEQLFEHLNLASCQFVPFTLLFLIRTLRYGRIRDGLLAGVFFALNALCSWHLGLLLFLVALPCFVFFFYRSPCRGRSFAWLCAGAFVSTVVLAPFLYPMVSQMLTGKAYFIKPLVYRPIDPAFLVFPPPQSTVAGSLAREIYLTCRGNAGDIATAFRSQYAGFICFLGWVPLLCVLSLLVRVKGSADRAQVVFWLCVFLLFVVFACGSHLTFCGTAYPSVTLPQGWLAEVGFFRVLRVADRYLVCASCAFSILVGLAVSRLPRAAWFRGALLFLIGLEFLWVPFPLRRAPRFEAAESLGKAGTSGIVLEIPVCLRAAQADAMYRQTLHGLPLAGGYAAAVPPWKQEDLLKKTFLQGLSLQKPPGARFLPPPRITRSSLKAMAQYGIRYIIVKPHESKEELRKRYEQARAEGTLPFFVKTLRPGRGFRSQRLRLILDQLARYLDEPLFEDKKIQVWELPQE